jgi:hypothetical protein
MLAFKPKDLMGRPVRSPDGELIGTIRGVCQRSSEGPVDQVRIVRGEDVVFARARDLVPTGTEYMCRGVVYS